MDYIAILNEKLEDFLKLVDYGEYPDCKVASVGIDTCLEIKFKTNRINVLKRYIDVVKNDEELELMENLIERLSKEKQLLEQFAISLCERLKNKI